MKVWHTIIPVIFLNTFLFAILVAGAIPAENQEIKKVRAQIGILIKSEDQDRLAQANDVLTVNDKLRLFIKPEAGTYVYIVYRDHKKAELLNENFQVEKDQFVILPSDSEYYQVDGTSKIESFTIICSVNEIREIAELDFANDSLSKWARIEKSLVNKSRTRSGTDAEKPISIAGNVRSAFSQNILKQLPVYAGDSLVLKRYIFRVKDVN